MDRDIDAMRRAKPGEIIKRGSTVFIVSEVVDGHVWGNTSFIPGECCRICGMMRRKDHGNKPCRGAPTLRL